jgi:hypothetical protein
MATTRATLPGPRLGRCSVGNLALRQRRPTGQNGVKSPETQGRQGLADTRGSQRGSEKEPPFGAGQRTQLGKITHARSAAARGSTSSSMSARMSRSSSSAGDVVLLQHRLDRLLESSGAVVTSFQKRLPTGFSP